MNHAITTLVEASETDLEGGAGNDDPDLRAQPDMNDDSNDTVASLPLDEYRIYNGRPSLSLPSASHNMANGYISFALFEDKDTSRFRAIIMSAIIYVLRYWSNILLVFVPIGTSAPHVGCSDSVVFIVNCLAIISLADVLCRATDDVSGLLGETAGALLNVTMGNATEVVIFVHALLQRQYMIVRTSLLRSIIVNLLLVFGLAIVTGEAQQRGQAYNILATRMAAGTLCLTTILLLVPSALRISSDKFEVSDANLALSRDISIVLILVYGIYLVSQIKSTKYAYKPLIQLDPDDCEQLEVVPIDYINQSSYHRRTLSYPRHPTTLSSFDDLLSYHSPKQATISRIVARIETIKSIPWIRKTLPIASFIVSTGFISISGGYLVDSIDHFVDHSPVSKIMIGLIILPIVGNAAELLSGIMFASRKQMNLAFAVAIGSAIQITLFITPLIVVVGWGLGREMALNFTHFEALALITSTALFSSLIHDDRCSLLKGVGLVAGYTVIT